MVVEGAGEGWQAAAAGGGGWMLSRAVALRGGAAARRGGRRRPVEQHSRPGLARAGQSTSGSHPLDVVTAPRRPSQ